MWALRCKIAEGDGMTSTVTQFEPHRAPRGEVRDDQSYKELCGE